MPLTKVLEPESRPVQIDEPAPIIETVLEVETPAQTKFEESESPKVKTATKPHAPREPEIFSAFIPESARQTASGNNGPDWQREIFTIGVRLFGLVLVFLFVIGIPDLAGAFYLVLFKPIGTDAALSEMLFNLLLPPLAKLLFYLVFGIYLIASGRVLIWLLPRG